MENYRKSLCCISINLQKDGHRYQTMTRKRFLSLSRKEALKLIGDKTLNNLQVLSQTIDYCAKNKWNLRISSDLIPLITLPNAKFTLKDLPQYKDIMNCFDVCKSSIIAHNLRCSTHPDQFVVLGSIRQETRVKSIIELNNHAYIMDLLGLPQNYQSPINIHLNCFKNQDLNEVSERFIQEFNTLQPSVKQRLVLENEDKKNSWSTRKLYKYFYESVGIPITYDSHHHRLNRDGLSAKKAFELAKSTWGNYKPLFHFSNGKKNKKDKSHSDYVYDVHKELFDGSVDIEFEFKMKDLALEKFEEKYNK